MDNIRQVWWPQTQSYTDTDNIHLISHGLCLHPPNPGWQQSDNRCQPAASLGCFYEVFSQPGREDGDKCFTQWHNQTARSQVWILSPEITERRGWILSGRKKPEHNSRQAVMAHLHFGCWLLFLFSSHRMLRANAPLLPVSMANKILKYYRRDTIVLYSGWWPVQPVQAAAVRPT